MPQKLLQRREIFRGGENLSVEPEKVQLPEFKRLRDWEIQKDWLPETSPGYAKEFEISRRVQLATMESEEASWAGSSVFEPADGAADTPLRRRQGLKSRKHVHPGAGTLTSTLTPTVAFRDMADMAADGILNFFFFHTTRANVTSIEIRFRKAAGDYFSVTYVTADLTAGDNASTAKTKTFATMTQVGALTWDELVDMQVITVASGATDLAFDDFYATSAAATTEPITGAHGFERIGTPEQYLVAESGDAIYSRDNTGSLVVRYAGRRRLAMEHFINGNDMVIAVNGQDPPLRWDPSENAFFRKLGVPTPPDRMTGAGAVGTGTVGAGTYFGKVTFDMGKHGEGNPSGPTAAIVVMGAQNEIAYSAIPIGPPGTIRRLIYRTQAGASSPFFFDVVVPDNTTTTINSKNSDSLLGAEIVEDGNEPPVLRLIAFASNTLFGVPFGQPSFIRYSDVTRTVNRTIEQWKTTNEMRLDPDDGDAITALVSHRGYIYAFKRFGCYLIDPSTTVPVPRKISSVYGALSQRSVVDTGSALVFWSPRYGPVAVSGTEFRLLGDDIRSKEGPYPGVEDVSQGIVTLPSSGSTDERKFETQTDWETGTFLSTSASVFPGILSYAQGGTNFQSSVPNRNTPVSQTISAGLTGSSPSNAVDSDGSSPWFIIDDLPLAPGTASLNMLAVPLVPINHVEIALTALSHPPFRDVKWAAIELYAGATLAHTFPAGTLNINQLGTPDSITLAASFAAQTSATWTLRFIDFPNSDGRVMSLSVRDVSLYEQGFTSTGEWESPNIDLGASPTAWGIFNAQFESISFGDVRFYLKSSAVPGGGTYAEIFPGIQPGTALNRHIKFKVAFGPNDGKKTPKVMRMALPFTFSGAGAFTPTFDSSAFWFEDRYWFCPVRRGQLVPQGLWKLGKGGGWSEHDDYAMSTWIFHGGAMMSGSSLNGKVFRNVRDAQGLKYTSREGRPIDAFLDTGYSQLSDQMVKKTVLEYVVAARNEKALTGEFLLNGDFEKTDIFSNTLVTGQVPTSWSIVSPPGQVLGRSTTIVDANFQPTSDVYSGNKAVKIEGSSSIGLAAFLAQKVYLRNATPYVLRWAMKNRGAPGLIKISTADGFILQADGTWAATGNGISLADVGNSYSEQVLSFITQSDVENRNPVEVRFWYPPALVGGLMLIDKVSLRERAPGEGFLTIQPILDGVPQEPEQVLFTFPPSGELAEERFPVDQAGVLNCGFRIRHRSASSSCKLFGILVSFGPERVRNDG